MKQLYLHGVAVFTGRGSYDTNAKDKTKLCWTNFQVFVSLRGVSPIHGMGMTRRVAQLSGGGLHANSTLGKNDKIFPISFFFI